MVITIFQAVQKYALSLVRCQACQVWIMGGVVLWFQCLVNSEPAPTIFLWAQIYYNKATILALLATILLLFPFNIFYYFITCSPSK